MINNYYNILIIFVSFKKSNTTNSTTSLFLRSDCIDKSKLLTLKTERRCCLLLEYFVQCSKRCSAVILTLQESQIGTGDLSKMCFTSMSVQPNLSLLIVISSLLHLLKQVSHCPTSGFTLLKKELNCDHSFCHSVWPIFLNGENPFLCSTKYKLTKLS